MSRKKPFFQNIALYVAGIYYGWQKARLADLKAEVARTRNILKTGDIPNAFEFTNAHRKEVQLEKKLKSIQKIIIKIKRKWKF